MARELTAYEVLDVAERMERNTARFYRRAAGLYGDPRIGKLFSELARWEKRHIQIIIEMKEHLSERTWELGYFGPERLDTDSSGLPNMVFDEHADPSKELTGKESKADVLRMAIQKEKDAIAYYTSLKEFVLGEQNVEAVDDIIQEEQRHVRILTQSLEQIT